MGSMDIKSLSNRIEKEINDHRPSRWFSFRINKIAAESVREKFGVTHYGANDIHPKYLVYWICVKSDAEKERLQADQALMKRLRKVLDDFNYPIEGRKSVHIGFESPETVDRESKGNWFYHWK